MITNNEISRMSGMSMSKIVDHNIYLDTDSLYDPLRNTLRKSAIKLDMRQSRIARNMRFLSPLQAQQIKNSTYIPVDRRLIPTHNIEKVQGKRFSAVNYQQKIYQPLSQQEFKRVAKPLVDDVVYEVGNENPYYPAAEPKIQQKRSNFPNKKQMSKESALPKSKYKYNLFSIIDEAGNTDCKSGCCVGNEIIASKRRNETNWF